MKILAYFKTDNIGYYGAMIAPFYAGDNIKHIYITLGRGGPITHTEFDRFMATEKSPLFDNYKQAHKYAYIETFGEEAYNEMYSDT